MNFCCDFVGWLWFRISRMSATKTNTTLGELQTFANTDKAFGDESHYLHVIVRSGSVLRDLVLTSQEYAMAMTRAERGLERLPGISRLGMIWLRVKPGMLLLILLMAIGLIAQIFTGCSTPGSYIQYGQVKLKLPKDSSWDLLAYEQTTNRTWLIISNANFKMNPEVLDAQSRRELQAFEFGKAAGAAMIGAAVKGATK